MSRKTPFGSAVACMAGSILIEVVIAVLLAGLLVGELAAGFLGAEDRAAHVEAQAASVGPDTAASGGDPWSWGPSVSWLCWDAGPVLRVGSRQRDRAEQLVAGLWADGWFLGEQGLGSDAGLTISAATWQEMQGRELVVRIRESEGEWGPPWRSVVPNVYGDTGGEKAVGLPAAEQAGVLGGQAVAVHVPSLATAVLEASWSDHPQESVGLGAPLFLVPSTSGLSDIAVSDNVQSWFGEPGRAVDVYF